MTASLDARRASGKFELVPVRRRDARRLREYGPPLGVTLPDKHGGKADPRYPSRVGFRTGLGFVVDLLVHLGSALGIGLLGLRDTGSPGWAILFGLGGFVAVSIFHRVLVQRACHTTLGKVLTGLRLIRDDTGGSPTLWSLIKAWLIGAVALVLSVLSG